jgi:hypothetical protein
MFEVQFFQILSTNRNAQSKDGACNIFVHEHKINKLFLKLKSMPKFHFDNAVKYKWYQLVSLLSLLPRFLITLFFVGKHANVLLFLKNVPDF